MLLYRINGHFDIPLAHETDPEWLGRIEEPSAR